MSDIVVTSADNQVVERQILANSNATTIYTCPSNQIAKALGVNVFNDSGGSVTVTVALYDGSSTFVIQRESVADDARSYVDLHGTVLIPTEEIRVTGALDIHVVADVLESGRG